MDVLKKIYEMASTGHSVGFRPSRLDDRHITLVVRKENKISENDLTEAAFTSHAVMNAVLDDVSVALATATPGKR